MYAGAVSWVGLQANCALPKGLQQTVETLAPSHRPFRCVNICAPGFSQEETEAQISVLEGWSLQEAGPREQPFQKEYILLLLSAPSQAAPSPNGAPPSDLGLQWCLPCMAAGSSCVRSSVDGSSLCASQPLCRLWSSTQVCQVSAWQGTGYSGKGQLGETGQLGVWPPYPPSPV